MINLTHHGYSLNDEKVKFQSHEVSISETDFYNSEYDIFSRNPFDITGYGSTKEEAVEDFKRKFEYVLAEWNAFGKIIFCPAVQLNITEVDRFGKPIPSGPVLPENAKPGDIFIQEI